MGCISGKPAGEEKHPDFAKHNPSPEKGAEQREEEDVIYASMADENEEVVYEPITIKQKEKLYSTIEDTRGSDAAMKTRTLDDRNLAKLAGELTHDDLLGAGQRPKWYHGELSREEADELLLDKDARGSFYFLARTSKAKYIISICATKNGERVTRHLRLTEKDSQLWDSKGNSYRNLKEVVSIWKEEGLQRAGHKLKLKTAVETELDEDENDEEEKDNEGNDSKGGGIVDEETKDSDEEGGLVAHPDPPYLEVTK